MRDLDDDGYPTEELLERVKAWPHTDSYHDLLALVEANWNWAPSMFQRKGKFYMLSTGGWSGNEDLIGALQSNTMFWLLCWVSSKRGGHYVFEVERQPAARVNAGVKGLPR